MKKVIVVCLLAFLASFVSVANASLLTNGDFESVSDGWVNDWSVYPDKENDSVYFAAKTSPVYEGTYSAKIAARQGYGIIFQNVTSGFSVGDTLSLSMLCLGDGNNDWQMDEVGDQVDLFIKFKDASGAQIGEEASMVIFDADESTDTPILSATEWLQSEAFEFVVPEHTDSLLVKIRAVDGSIDGNNSDGTACHIDAVSLTVVPEPATLMLLGLGGLAALRRRK